MFATLFVAASLSASPPQPAVCNQPRYFFLLFGSQSIPFVPRTAHTWATFVKVTTDPSGGTVIEPITISWLPADASVEPFRLRSVEGKNYDLAETLAIAKRDQSRVSVWGPYEIDAERFQLAVAQANKLESGKTRYRVFDSLGFNHSISHCVHAVTYADPRLKHRIQPVLQVGEPGTSRLAARYVRCGAFVNSNPTQDWLLSALGLEEYGVIRREPGELILRRFVR